MNDLIGPEPPEPSETVRADALERAETAWQVRVRGGTWDTAALTAGYSSKSNAIRGVRRVFGTLPALDRNEARRLWRHRLELAWRQVVADMEDRVPGATTAAVRVADRASRLDGLDEPARLSLTPSDGALQAFVANVLAARHDPLPVETDIFADIEDADVIED